MSALGLGPSVLYVLAFVILLLIVARVVVWRQRQPGSELALRVRSWTVMVGIFVLALLVGKWALLALLAVISFLALKEYLSLIPTRRADRRVLLWAYLAIPLQYSFIFAKNYGMFIVFIPVYMFLFLPTLMVLLGETRQFLTAIGTLMWGLMLCVFCLGHMGFLLQMPADNAGIGLLICLLLLTQLNDVSQYLWGKRFGRHKILPTVSPNKSVEGFLGGVVTTTILALVLGPLLSPMSWPMALWVGPLIAFFGFIGDVTMSAFKRDLGLKDSSTLIPGHGGILDRVDSLIYTAPLFFHILRFFYYLPA